MGWGAFQVGKWIPTAKWPRGRNIPLAAASAGLDVTVRFGQDTFLRGFWFAFLQAKRAAGATGASQDDEAHYEGFRKLVSRCLVDVCVEADPHKVGLVAFAEVLKTEEAREADGFTGFRAVLLVDWGFKNC